MQLSRLILSLALLVLVAGACAPSTSTTSGGQSKVAVETKPAAESKAVAGGSPSPSPAAAGGAVAKGPTGGLTLRLGHDSAEASTKHAGAVYWAKLLADKGVGLQMQVFPAGALGHDPQGVQGLQLGTIDGWIVGTSILFASVPEMQLFSLPYLFDDTQQALRFYERAPIVKELSDKALQKGVRILAWGDLGFRNLSNNVRPIKTAEDVAGLKMRVPAVALYQKVWQGLGTTTTQVDFSELYLALQQGVVDGQDNPIELTYSNKFYEVQKYYSLIQWAYEAYPFMISETTWKRLTPEQQQALQATAIEAARWQTEETVKREEEMLKDMEARGMSIERNVDRESFKRKLQTINEALEQQFGKELIERVRKEAADARQ